MSQKCAFLPEGSVSGSWYLAGITFSLYVLCIVQIKDVIHNPKYEAQFVFKYRDG